MMSRCRLFMLTAVFMCTAQALALDIEEVEIIYTASEMIGHEHDFVDCWGHLKVSGSGISSVTATAPDNTTYDLYNNYYEPDVWQCDEWAPGIAELELLFPTGIYSFNFNEGERIVTVEVNNLAWPVEAPVVTNPENYADNVPQFPTFEWESVQGTCDYLDLEVSTWASPVVSQSVLAHHTSWLCPYMLDKNEEYSFYCATVEAQGPEQVTGTDAFIFGVYKKRITEIAFIVEADFSVIYASLSIDKQHIANQVTATPYEMLIWIEGMGIDQVDVVAPSQIQYSMNRVTPYYSGSCYELRMNFASQQAMLDALGYGDYVFDFNNGEDSAVITFSYMGSLDVPDILYPSHNQSDVELNPVIQWTSPAGMCQTFRAHLYIDSTEPFNWVDGLYEWDNPGSTQLTLQNDLQPGHDYYLVMDATNDDYNSTTTDLGTTFGYDIWATYNNMIKFDTKEHAELLIEEILILKNTRYTGGVLEDTPYRFEVEISGSGINSIIMRDPNGIDHNLEPWDSDGEWGLEYEYPSEAARDAAWPAGNYTFTFNAGEDNEDTVTLPHTVATPAAYPTVTYPLDGAGGVGPDPLYEWTLTGDGIGSVIAVFLEQNLGDDEWDDIDEDVPLPIETTTWQSENLSPNSTYAFLVSVANIQGGEFYEETTDSGQHFLYKGVSLQEDEVEFNTAPMPDVDNILLVTMLRHVDGQPAAMPARAMFSVDGTYTNISVRTPNAEEVQLQQVDDEFWMLVEDFASSAELDNKYPAGNYLFTFNGGFDTTEVFWGTAIPGEFPDIVSHDHNQQNVILNPEFAWTPVACHLQAAFVNDANTGEEYDVAFPLGVDVPAWQPRTLEQLTDYTFEIAAGLASTPSGPEIRFTANQDQYEFLAIGANCNSVDFKTGGWRIPGDVSGDCQVDNVDLILVRNRLGAQLPGTDEWLADVNQDGTVDLLDLVIVRNLLGTSCTE